MGTGVRPWVSERSVLASVRHPFVVRMPAHFQDEATLYMVLQYVPGGEAAL